MQEVKGVLFPQWWQSASSDEKFLFVPECTNPACRSSPFHLPESRDALDYVRTISLTQQEASSPSSCPSQVSWLREAGAHHR